MNLFKQNAVMTDYHASLRSEFETTFKVRINLQHTDPQAVFEVALIAGQLCEHSIRKSMVKDEQLAYVSRDFYALGMSKIAGQNKITAFHAKSVLLPDPLLIISRGRLLKKGSHIIV